MIPTLFGIMLVSFAIVQFVPGGPVERAIAQLQNADQNGSVGGASAGAGDIASRYRGAQGLDPKFIKELEKQYGFDKPAWERFWILVRDYSTFNLGRSYYRDAPVIAADPREAAGLDVARAVDDADLLRDLDSARRSPRRSATARASTSGPPGWSIFGYAIPSFLFAILLLTLFGGGSFWAMFPLRGLTSDNFADLDWPHKILDYLWHITLPVASLVLGSFATSTLADQEFVPRRDPEGLRADGADEGPERAAGALRPRVPQRDADRHRRLSRRLRRRVLRRARC